MTTDPGDLVLDPTCGSGTTAYVAEQWGRRWITCDTSRVAITLAKQRLMTAVYDYYELAHPEEGVGSGFKYKTVPHITLKSIANNEPPAEETLYDQPYVDRQVTRVSGPFTVEAVPAPTVQSVDDLLLHASTGEAQDGRRLGRAVGRDAAAGRMARRAAADRHPRQGRPAHPLRPAGAAARLPLAARRRRDPPQRRGRRFGEGGRAGLRRRCAPSSPSARSTRRWSSGRWRWRCRRRRRSCPGPSCSSSPPSSSTPRRPRTSTRRTGRA